jgi:hypothetical protein
MDGAEQTVACEVLGRIRRPARPFPEIASLGLRKNIKYT